MKRFDLISKGTCGVPKGTKIVVKSDTMGPWPDLEDYLNALKAHPDFDEWKWQHALSNFSLNNANWQVEAKYI